MLVFPVPSPLQTFPADSDSAEGELSLCTEEGRAEGEVVDPGLMVVAALMVVTCQYSHHTAGPLQEVQDGLK